MHGFGSKLNHVRWEQLSVVYFSFTIKCLNIKYEIEIQGERHICAFQGEVIGK